MHSTSDDLSSKGNIAFHWALKAIETAVKRGIDQAVISPGSRSTPLTLAAAIHPGIEKMVVLDERSAAFIALGISKATGIPPLLICTSGTAAANYYPAVIEAHQSAVPLVILSADRPPALQHSGANQTINQIRLFGDYALFYDTGLPPKPPELMGKLRDISELLQQSIKKRNPVHINWPFEKPLEPAPDYLQSAQKQYETAAIDTKITLAGLNRREKIPSILKNAIQNAERPLVMAGVLQVFDSLVPALSQLAVKIDAPVVAEFPSQWFSRIPSDRIISGYDLFFRNKVVCEALRPDLIITTGDAWISKGIEYFLRRHCDVTHIHLSSSGRPNNPFGSVSTTFQCRSHQLVWPEVGTQGNKRWVKKWNILSSKSRAQAHKQLKSSPAFTDWHAVEMILSKLDSSFQLVAGNSLSVRDSCLWADPVRHHQPVYVNRGASGIDGNISTAIGVARAGKKPVAAIVGDLTFLHDANALLSLGKLNEPCLIFVINNGGGSIFDMLPVAEHISILNTYFRTPQTVQIESVARAHSIAYTCVENRTEMDRLLKNGLFNQPHIIECKTDAVTSMRLRKKLWNFSWDEYL